MRSPTQLAFGVLLFSAAVACKPSSDRGRGTEAPAVTGAGSQGPRTTPGPLVESPIVIVFAVYALPDGAEDVESAARTIREESFSHLSLLEGPPDPSALPGVVIDVPPMHEFAPPDLEMIEYFGHGLDDDQKQALQRSPKAVVMTFVADAAGGAELYESAVKMTTAVAERTGGLAWDEETREVFGHEAWKSARLPSTRDFENLTKHFVIHAYRSGELVRLVTLGMRKFGLPDIVVEDVPGSLVDSMMSVVNLVAITLAMKQELPSDGKLRVDFADLVAEDPPSGLGRADVELRPGRPDEGDPANRLLEIVFPGPRPSLHERQVALVDALLGSTESVVAVDHDAKLLALSREAKRRLAELEPLFAKGVPERELLIVKAPFPTDDGGTEYMWVEVTSWKGEWIDGILQNDPFRISGLKAGARVRVNEDDVFDFIHQLPDGTREGNATGELLMKREAGQ